MNPRDRIIAVLKGEKPDLVPWFGDLDYWITGLKAQGISQDSYQGSGLFKLHRDLGVGFYLQGYFPFLTLTENIQVTQEQKGHTRHTRLNTPVGELECIEVYLPESFCWAYQKHFIKNWKDFEALRYWVNHTHYQPDYGRALEYSLLIGNQGLVLGYLPKSPFMELVALLAGITAVTEAYIDAPEELEETLTVMEIKATEAAMIALNSPCECLMIPENLSSEVVGKRFYNLYMRKYEKYWVDKIRDAGKFSFIHVDGTLKGLIREVASTGFDVLEALTPAPVGDIPIEEIHNWAGDHSIVWGGIPGIYFTDLIGDLEFDQFVIRILETMCAIPRHVLGVADQVPPGSRWERIKRVNELVEQFGMIKW